jgi:hypothetical protein
MVKNLIIIATLCCLLPFTYGGCGGGGGGGSSGSGSSVESGPLAGTWTVDVNDVTHTITIVGRGTTYDAAWDTSDHCFTSDAGTAVHINDNVEILCSGYDDDETSHFFMSIFGEYDGENTITGNMRAEECGADDELVDLIR